MISDEKYEQLMRFYSGELPLEETHALELELKTNSELADAFENIDLLEKATLQARLFDVEQLAKTTYQNQVRREKKLKWGIISAGALLLGVYAYWYFTKNSTETNTSEDLPKTKASIRSEVQILESVNSGKNTTHLPNKANSVSENPSNKTKTTETDIPSKILKPSIQEKAVQENFTTHSENKIINIRNEKMHIKAVNNATISSKENEKATINPCESSPMELTILSTATCVGEENGSVRVSISGGKSPYFEQIVDADNRKYPSAGLPVGQYLYQVTDVNNCKKIRVFEIQTKVCAQHFEFNPFLGKTISFEAQKGKLIIQTQRGESYFEKELSENELFEWDGKSNGGSSSTGLYLFRIEQNGKQVQFGTITVVE